MTPPNTLFAALVFLVPGCALDGPALESDSQAIESANSLTYNKMSDNRLSYNRLSYNRLSYNRLSYNRLSYNRLSYNGLDNDMQNDAEGREILEYIARCALTEGDVLVADVDGRTYEFPGLLGLAPKWEDAPLDRDGQEKITACLLAHTNKFGVSVPISVRHPALPSSVEEEARFSRLEGAFFGNLFDDVGDVFSCHTADAPPRDAVDLSFGDRLLRVCTDHSCQSLALGPQCSDVCTTNPDGSYATCANRKKENKSYRVFNNIIQIFVLDADDPASVWPKHLDIIEAHYTPPPTTTESTNWWSAWF